MTSTRLDLIEGIAPFILHLNQLFRQPGRLLCPCQSTVREDFSNWAPRWPFSQLNLPAFEHCDYEVERGGVLFVQVACGFG